MLYTLIGNGEANTKEVLLSLQSLRGAVENKDDFWMLFQEPGPEVSLSNTVDAILKWVIAEQIYHEIVVAEGGEVTNFMSADQIHQAKRPSARMLTLTKGRVQPDEQYAVLILSDDIEADDTALFAINQAVTQDIPVFDLGGQMVPLALEEEEPQPEPVPLDNKGFTLPAPTQVSDEEAVAVGMTKEEVVATRQEEEPEYVYADLAKMTRDELKSMATVRNLSPKDWRSKDSIMVSLLEHAGLPVPTELLPEDDPRVPIATPSEQTAGVQAVPEQIRSDEPKSYDTAAHEAAVVANEEPQQEPLTGIEVRLILHHIGGNLTPTEGVLEKLISDGFGLLSCVAGQTQDGQGQVIYTMIKNHGA